MVLNAKEQDHGQYGATAGTVLGAGQMAGIAFAHGLTIMIMVAAFGDISGGHINPAVTAGLAAAGEFPLRRVIPYWIVQIAGAHSRIRRLGWLVYAAGP